MSIGATSLRPRSAPRNSVQQRAAALPCLRCSIATVLFILYCGMSFLLAQETPSPAASSVPAVSPGPSSASPARSIRISFLPPPLSGKITLGIFDEWDQLVRVLHEQAPLDEFTAGADALVTKWDGKDDYGFEVPSGRYHARGFLVAPMKIDEVAAETIPSLGWSTRVKLMPNPLEKNERPVVVIATGADEERAFLQTADGLPLLTLAEGDGLKSSGLSLGHDSKSLLVQLTGEAGTRSLRVSGVEKMMAFDAGDFELK